MQWCEVTLGIAPGASGDHTQYAMHNRLFKITTPAHPLAYFEIVAINPDAKRPANAHGKHWFDMDDATLQATITTQPRLLYFVVNTGDIQSTRIELKKQDIDLGPVMHASRHSRCGVLQWQITVRDNGQRLFKDALPLPGLIQWGKPNTAEPLRLHPRNSLPRLGVTLQSISITHPTATKLKHLKQPKYRSVSCACGGVHIGKVI